MEPYDTFIDQANQIIREAHTQFGPESSRFQRSYFEAMIREVESVKQMITLHRDIMNPPAETLFDP